MTVSRVSRIAVAAYFHHILIPLITKIFIGNRYPYIASVCKIIITVFRRSDALLQGHMLPDVFRKKSCRQFVCKHPLKICPVKQIKLVFLCAYPAVIIRFSRSDNNSHIIHPYCFDIKQKNLWQKICQRANYRGTTSVLSAYADLNGLRIHIAYALSCALTGANVLPYAEAFWGNLLQDVFTNQTAVSSHLPDTLWSCFKTLLILISAFDY